MADNQKFSLPKLVRLKLKFATSSLLATIVDYLLYLYLVGSLFSPVISNVISAGTGMLINFLVQKTFVFELRRKLRTTFAISFITSLIGLSIGTGLIFLFNKLPLLHNNQYITKAIVIAIVFFYNFYMKRFAFEKRFV